MTTVEEGHYGNDTGPTMATHEIVVPWSALQAADSDALRFFAAMLLAEYFEHTPEVVSHEWDEDLISLTAEILACCDVQDGVATVGLVHRFGSNGTYWVVHAARACGC